MGKPLQAVTAALGSDGVGCQRALKTRRSWALQNQPLWRVKGAIAKCCGLPDSGG